MITIKNTCCDFEREPILRPFGFKGGYLSELWQTIAGLESTSGARGMGLNTQSVLWSDADVFTSVSEAAGNAIMFAMTGYALKLAKGMSFETPFDLQEQLLPPVLEYGRALTGKKDLRMTFALNALVGVDTAAWVLYAREHGMKSFDEMLPERYRSVLSRRHRKLACIPLMTYGVPVDEIVRQVDEGYFFLKIKIGSDPEHDGDREKMLQWDMARLEAIHNAIGDRRTPYTTNGKIPYYLDANGRYDSRQRLERFLEHCDKIGALDQIAILEEPFPEDFLEDVSGMGVRIAADESAHSDQDVQQRIALGYSAFTLKPIAKTLSMTLKIADIAQKANIPMFCADLTVGPVEVEWNKSFAARIDALPNMKVGVVETNGHQNFTNWETMKSYHPVQGAPWTEVRDGCFDLDDSFYEQSGATLMDSRHYADIIFK